MSAFKGTPGPWQISTENQTIIKQDMSLIGLPNGGVLIGSACGHESSGFFPTTDQAAANARLIAAAPELLEACQTALAFVAGWAGVYQHDHGLPDFHPRHKEAIEQVKYAIAKATGEEP